MSYILCLHSPRQRTCVFKFLGAIAMDLGKERLGPYITTIIAPLYRELDSTYADQGTRLRKTTYLFVMVEKYSQRLLEIVLTLTVWLCPDPTLKNLARELIELLKKQVGLEKFSLAFSAVQKEFSQRRAARKRRKAMQVWQTPNYMFIQEKPYSVMQMNISVPQAVSNPDIAAKKKLKKHKNKIEAKKRKIEFLRPGYKAKKQRSHALKDLAMVKWAMWAVTKDTCRNKRIQRGFHLYRDKIRDLEDNKYHLSAFQISVLLTFLHWTIIWKSLLKGIQVFSVTGMGDERSAVSPFRIRHRVICTADKGNWLTCCYDALYPVQINVQLFVIQKMTHFLQALHLLSWFDTTQTWYNLW